MYAQQGTIVEMQAAGGDKGYWMLWKPRFGEGNDATGLPKSAEGKVKAGDRVTVIFRGPNENSPVFGVLVGSHLYTHQTIN